MQLLGLAKKKSKKKKRRNYKIIKGEYIYIYMIQNADF